MAARSNRDRFLAYAIVGVALVAIGVVVRTIVLNWVIGPAFVVVGVSLVSRVFDRKEARR